MYTTGCTETFQASSSLTAEGDDTEVVSRSISLWLAVISTREICWEVVLSDIKNIPLFSYAVWLRFGWAS